jgi:4-hydroxy-3-methylbut-2-en-1-yl diphosphate synthase IspG/GcpE
MHQRYCECGHPVLVAYVITGRGILHLFQTRARMTKLMRCPCCGRHIDINDLR